MSRPVSAVAARRRPHWLSGVLALGAIALIAQGCSARQQASDPGSVDPRGPTTIRVINNNFSDATLWANMPGRRQFLGRLTGKTEANYTLEVPVAQAVTIEIDLLAGSRCVTNELIVDPGDELFLTIESALEEMGICRRRGS